MALTQDQKISNSFAAKYPNAGYKTYSDTPSNSSSSSSSSSSSGSSSSSSSNPFTPAPSPFTSTTNTYTAPEQKTTLANPTPSASVGQTINPISGVINSPSRSGGGSNLPQQQSSISNITPSADVGQTINPLTGGVNSSPQQFQQIFTPNQTALTPFLPSYQESNQLMSNQNTVYQPAIKALVPSTDYGFVNPYQSGLGNAALQSGETFLGGVGKLTGIDPIGFGSNLLQGNLAGAFSSIRQPDLSGGFSQIGGTFDPFSYAGTPFKPSGLLLPLKQEAFSLVGLGGLNTGNIITSTFYQPTKAEVGINLMNEYQGMSVSSDFLNQKYSERTKGLTTVGESISTFAPMVIETGLLIGAPAVTSSIAGPALGTELAAELGLEVGQFTAGSIGFKDFASGVGSGRIGGASDNVFGMNIPGGSMEAASAIGFIGFEPALGIMNIPKELSVEAGTRELGQAAFNFGEIQFDKGDTAASFIKGYREAGGLRQEISVVGPIIKNDEVFLQPGSQFQSSIGGTVDNFFADREGFKFLGGSKGYIGGKGFTLELEGTDKLVSFGKGTLVKEWETSAVGKLGASNDYFSNQFAKNAKTFEYGKEFQSPYFTGVTKQYGEDVFASKSGKISSMEINPEKITTISSGEFNKGTIDLYHVTPEKNVKGILDQGLIPSKASGIHGVIGESDRVYTTLSRPVAENYNTMLGGKGSILEIKMPKDKVFGAIVDDAKMRTGVGQIGQVTFDSIPSRYIAGSKDFLKDTTTFKEVREGLLVKTNLKDFTLTKVYSGSKIETTFDIQASKGMEQGLIQQTKSSFKPGSGLITTNTIQEFKQDLVPKSNFGRVSQITQSVSLGSFKAGSFGIGALSTSLKTENKFKTGLSSGLGSMNIQSSNTQSMFKTSNKLLTGQQTQFKTDQKFSQSFKTALDTSQATQQQQKFKTDFTGFPSMGGSGGFKGVDLGNFGFPDLGSGLGVAPRRIKATKRKKGSIAPSFTAEAFNLRGALPKSGEFGVNPFQIRRIPKGKKNPFETKF